MSKLKSVPNKIKVDLPKEEPKAERTIETIQQEYGALCARAGQLQYQVFAFSRDLEMINSQVRDLSFEAASLKNKQSEESKSSGAV